MLTSAGALTIARHTENGLVTSTTLDDTIDTYEYNDFGEPSRQTSTVDSTQVFDVQISRDDLGRISQRIEVVDGITRVFHYSYDLAGRLETVTRDGISGQVTVVAYTYDANGNRLTAEGEAYGGGAPIAATYDDQDRLLTYGTASYTYTANGELRTKTVGSATTTYTYDTLGNLIEVDLPNSDVITYTIDGRGRRVGKSVNGTRVKGWLYADQLRPIAELDGSGDVVARFVYGAKPNVPEYIIKGGTTYRVFSDHLGSPRVIVDASTGVVVQRMDFQAFGEVTQDSNLGWQPFGFAGGLYDPLTGLLHFGARDYDPTLARWLSKDPMRFSAAETAFYSYSFANPVNFSDQSGLFIPAVAVPYVVGAVTGGVSGAIGAYIQNGTPTQIAIAAGLGAVAGASLVGPGLSAGFLALSNGLADAVGQLVGLADPCSKGSFSPAAVLASAAAGVTSGGLASMLATLRGYASGGAVAEALTTFTTGVSTALWAPLAAALDPFANRNR